MYSFGFLCVHTWKYVLSYYMTMLGLFKILQNDALTAYEYIIHPKGELTSSLLNSAVYTLSITTDSPSFLHKGKLYSATAMNKILETDRFYLFLKPGDYSFINFDYESLSDFITTLCTLGIHSRKHKIPLVKRIKKTLKPDIDVFYEIKLKVKNINNQPYLGLSFYYHALSATLDKEVNTIENPYQHLWLTPTFATGRIKQIKRLDYQEMLKLYERYSSITNDTTKKCWNNAIQNRYYWLAEVVFDNDENIYVYPLNALRRKVKLEGDLLSHKEKAEKVKEVVNALTPILQNYNLAIEPISYKKVNFFRHHEVADSINKTFVIEQSSPSLLQSCKPFNNNNINVIFLKIVESKHNINTVQNKKDKISAILQSYLSTIGITYQESQKNYTFCIDEFKEDWFCEYQRSLVILITDNLQNKRLKEIRNYLVVQGYNVLMLDTQLNLDEPFNIDRLIFRVLMKTGNYPYVPRTNKERTFLGINLYPFNVNRKEYITLSRVSIGANYSADVYSIEKDKIFEFLEGMKLSKDTVIHLLGENPSIEDTIRNEYKTVKFSSNSNIDFWGYISQNEAIIVLNNICLFQTPKGKFVEFQILTPSYNIQDAVSDIVLNSNMLSSKFPTTLALLKYENDIIWNFGNLQKDSQTLENTNSINGAQLLDEENKSQKNSESMSHPSIETPPEAPCLG